MNVYEVIRRPLVTEKGVDKKDNERTLVFEVSAEANKTQVKQAVEKLGHEAPGRRQLFVLQLMGLIAPPPGAGVLLRSAAAACRRADR